MKPASSPVRQDKAPRSPANRSRGSTLLGIFVGIIIGTLAALIVIWLMNRSPSPFVEKAQVVQPASPGQPAEPAPLPGKPGDPPQENRFQFYEILPGKTNPQPAKAPDPKAAPPKAAAADAGELYLQAGSFQTQKDAENFRASLALMGLEANIQPAKVDGKQWYRVRLGPYARFEDARKAKTDLAKAGIEAEMRRGKN
jgi:cell division protein FtsN